MEPSPKRPRLQQQGCTPTDGVAVMLTDVEDLQDGTLLLWGLAADRQTVLLRVNEYHPYFFIPCPHLVSPDSAQLQEPLVQDLQRLRMSLNVRYQFKHTPTKAIAEVPAPPLCTPHLTPQPHRCMYTLRATLCPCAGSRTSCTSSPCRCSS